MRKKKNEMLERIQKQPSSINLSSKVTKAAPIEPSDIISKKYANESLEVAKKASEFDKNIDAIAEALSDIKEPTSKLPKDVIYDKSGKLTDLSGKPHKFPKLKSLLGILPAVTAAALSAYAPESKASTIAKTVARVTDEGDPTSLLFPEGAGEGEDAEVMKMREEQKNKYFDNLMKNVPKNEKLRSEIELKKEVEPVVKILGGEPDMKPSKASKLTGEKSSPDLEEMDNSVNYEDYLKKKKRQLGYE